MRIDAVTCKGAPLLKLHNNSFVNTITNLIPEYDWKIWKFSQITRNFWRDISNQRKAMNQIFNDLKFTSKEDWYSIHSTVIEEDLQFKFVRHIYKGKNVVLTIHTYMERIPVQSTGCYLSRI